MRDLNGKPRHITIRAALDREEMAIIVIGLVLLFIGLGAAVLQ